MMNKGFNYFCYGIISSICVYSLYYNSPYKYKVFPIIILALITIIIVIDMCTKNKKGD